MHRTVEKSHECQLVIRPWPSLPPFPPLLAPAVWLCGLRILLSTSPRLRRVLIPLRDFALWTTKKYQCKSTAYADSRNRSVHYLPGTVHPLPASVRFLTDFRPAANRQTITYQICSTQSCGQSQQGAFAHLSNFLPGHAQSFRARKTASVRPLPGPRHPCLALVSINRPRPTRSGSSNSEAPSVQTAVDIQ